MSIELQTGTECLISDSSDAELYAAFEGDGNYILRKPLDLTMSSTNTLIIGPGTGLQNGRHIRFKGTTEVTIPSGVQAEKRSNIVVVRTTISRDEDTMETLTHSEAMVLTGKSTMDGEPTDPEWIEGNLLDGDTIADFPIARVVTDGINVREPEPLYNVLASAADFRDSQSPEIERHILSDYVSFYKASGLVFISFDGINCDTPEWKVIGTLPEGYRPLFNAYFPLWSNVYKTTSCINHSAHVNANGEVSIQSNNEAIAGYGLICFPHA